MRRSNISKIADKINRDFYFNTISQKVARDESERKQLASYLNDLASKFESGGLSKIAAKHKKSPVVIRLHKKFDIKFQCGMQKQFKLIDKSNPEHSAVVTLSNTDNELFLEGQEILRNNFFKDGRKRRLFNRFVQAHAPKVLVLQPGLELLIASAENGANLQHLIKYEQENPLPAEQKVKSAALMLATLLRLFAILNSVERPLVLTGLESNNLFIDRNGYLQLADIKRVAIADQSECKEISAYNLAMTMYEYLQNKTLDKMVCNGELVLDNGLPYLATVDGLKVELFNPDFNKLAILKGKGAIKETLRSVLTTLKEPLTLNMAFNINFRSLSQRMDRMLITEKIKHARCEELSEGEFVESLLYTTTPQQIFAPETQHRPATKEILAQNDTPAEIIHDTMQTYTEAGLQHGEISAKYARGAYAIAEREEFGRLVEPVHAKLSAAPKIQNKTAGYTAQQLHKKNWEENLGDLRSQLENMANRRAISSHKKHAPWQSGRAYSVASIHTAGERHRYSGDRH